MTAVVLLVVPLPPGLVERHYSTGLYAWMQPRLTAATNLVPWAVLDLLVMGAAIGAVGGLARWIRRWPGGASAGRRQHLGRLVRASLASVAGVYLAFLSVWGCNYRRAPIETRIDFDARRVTSARVRQLADEATRALNDLHAASHAVPWPAFDALPEQFGSTLAVASQRLGLGWTPLAGRPKRTLLGPYLRWAAVAGLTNPFGLEVLPGPDTLPFERYAVVSHEWSHLAGFAHEAEAGFVGWLMCMEGGGQARYSGWLDVWPSLVAALPSDERAAVLERLEEGPRTDLRAIAARNRRAVPAIREAAWRGYDAYLRSQHVAEGIASYRGVVRLLAGSSVAARAQPAR